MVIPNPVVASDRWVFCRLRLQKSGQQKLAWQNDCDCPVRTGRASETARQCLRQDRPRLVIAVFLNTASASAAARHGRNADASVDNRPWLAGWLISAGFRPYIQPVGAPSAHHHCSRLLETDILCGSFAVRLHIKFLISRFGGSGFRFSNGQRSG